MYDLILDFSKDELVFLLASNIQSIGIGLFICLLVILFINLLHEHRLSKRLEFLENFFEQLSDCVDVDAFKAYCDSKYKEGEDK